jgi:hypothetical protein
MSKYSKRLLILALLSAFAAASSGSAVAAEKERDKGKQRVSEQEQARGHEQSGEGRHDNDRHENDAALSMKTSVVTVTNRGASPLTITAPPSISRLSGKGNFAIVPPDTGTPCATSLVVAPRGGECTIGVKYIPSDGGRSTARLILTDSGAATPTQETVIRSDD